jgi:hypothetical protein
MLQYNLSTETRDIALLFGDSDGTLGNLVASHFETHYLSVQMK